MRDERRGQKTLDETVAELRGQLGVRGFPQWRDVWYLAGWLSDRIDVVVTGTDEAYSLIFPSGHAHIEIPESLEYEAASLALLEELGHFLLGEQALLAEDVGAESKERRQYLLWQDRDESKCRAFVLTWRLPFEFLAHYFLRFDQLAADSGCTPEEVQERVEQFERELSR